MANIYFVDTNILLNSSLEEFFNTENKICISSITFTELDNIKESARKDEEIKYKARVASRYLNENPDKYELVLYKEKYFRKIKKYGFEQTPDSKIIATAKAYSRFKKNFYFVTQDRNCGMIARAAGLAVEYYINKQSEGYRGYLEYNFSDEEMGEFYGTWLQQNLNPLNLLENEYLIVKNRKGIEVDSYKWSDNQYHKLTYPKFNNVFTGKLNPKDTYQAAAMDSLIANQLTLVGGPAGSGKTMIALSYMLQELEKGRIERLIIVCNPLAARGAARLGFMPGTRVEKLMSSQVGGVLSSKLGGEEVVLDLIDKGKIVLLPVADARGYQVPPYSCLYILESQNLSVELMKLILQRTSEDTKIIIDGDFEHAQVDSDTYAGSNNGMKKVIKIFAGEKKYGQVMLKNIYRSEIASIADKM